MEAVKYVIAEPYPAGTTVGESLCNDQWPTPYTEREVVFYTGSPKFTLPKDWHITADDFFCVDPEFVILECLWKGAPIQLGPFKFLQQTSLYVEVEDSAEAATGIRSGHTGDKFFRSTAVYVWSARCSCERAFSNQDRLPAVCLCAQLLENNLCWKCDRSDSTCGKRLSEKRLKGKSLKQMKEATRAPKKTKGESSKTKITRPTTEKEIHVSLTVDIIGGDIPMEVFEKIKNFVENRASIGIISLERGDSNLQLHVQGVLSIKYFRSSNANELKIAEARKKQVDLEDEDDLEREEPMKVDTGMELETQLKNEEGEQNLDAPTHPSAIPAPGEEPLSQGYVDSIRPELVSADATLDQIVADLVAAGYPLAVETNGDPQPLTPPAEYIDLVSYDRSEGIGTEEDPMNIDNDDDQE
ncbi:hypothetical protein R1sor_024936 [Riccia sorocarpa]|uniref:Uncharacterized protein n=1 Tax=Riccia sorocarpa TaxID=122646 RepID=A0ABD3G768_9MARC